MSLVLLNNPGKTAAQVLARPDVRESLREPFLEAQRLTTEAIEQAWRRGDELGLEHARRCLEILGLEVAEAPPHSPKYLSSVRADAERNAREVTARLRRAALDADREAIPEALRRIGSEYARRAPMGVEAAGSRAHGEREVLTYAASGVKQKVWVTHFRPTTCPSCAALHGRVLPVGQKFGTDSFGRTLSVYGDLLSPPRHPHCGCRLIPWVGPDEGVGRLRTFARRWWARLTSRS